MRLYNPDKCTLVGTPRARYQHTPKSFLPAPGANAVPSNRPPFRVLRASQDIRATLDSCRDSHGTASTGSTSTYNQMQLKPLELRKTQSKARLGCQSPVPEMQSGVRVQNTASVALTTPKQDYSHANIFPEFHFDIDGEDSESPFSSVRVYSLEDPPASFDIEGDDVGVSHQSNGANRANETNNVKSVDGKGDRSTCSSSTLSSNSLSCFPNQCKTDAVNSPLRNVDEHFPDGSIHRGNSVSSAMLSPPCQVECRQSSPTYAWQAGQKMKATEQASSPYSSPVSPLLSPGLQNHQPSSSKRFPARLLDEQPHLPSDGASSTGTRSTTTDQQDTPVYGRPRKSLMHPPTTTDHHCVNQAASFESSFNNVIEGESIVIMIHRKDHTSGVSSMRSYFRDERGQWSKFESI